MQLGALARFEGSGSLKDAKLYPGGARAWDWRETGTRHDPGIQPTDVAELLDHGAEVVVLSTGVFGVFACARKRSFSSKTRACDVTCCRRRTRSPRTTG